MGYRYRYSDCSVLGCALGGGCSGSVRARRAVSRREHGGAQLETEL